MNRWPQARHCADALPRRRVALLCAAAIAGPAIFALSATAQDLERERRLEAEIVDYILDGEPVHLDADGHSFLGIHAEADGDGPRRGVIVLHGRGFHPDWAEVAAPLRVELPEHGWETLSLQMPVLEKAARYYDYAPVFPAAFPRIRAGIEYLRAREVRSIVLAAHSCSVHMAMAYVRRHGDAELDGFIGIGMGATDRGQPMRKPFPLAAMSVPILDLFGDEDYPAVLREAPGRLRRDALGGAPAVRPAHRPRRRALLPRHGRRARRRGDGMARHVARGRLNALGGKDVGETSCGLVRWPAGTHGCSVKLPVAP